MSNERLIFDTARRTLGIEVETLAALRDSLDGSFVRVVELLAACRGRVVVTGIGKSALVGQKIVATFNSTGTPALFMHAADAIHGDLGMIQQDDVVLSLSKSGETAEMRALLPLLKRLGHTVIAAVAKPDSTLARQADYVLVTPVQQEADPHDLAPTASAIVQMALGDALASALLALRGFSPEDFAQFHPGGALGKQLYLTLAELGCHNECPSVGQDAPLQEVIVEMTTRRLGATAVVGERNQLLGIITDGDLRRAIGRGVEVVRLSAKQLMTPSPKHMADGELAVKGLALMREHHLNHLLLVNDDGQYSGMVHVQDFVREGLV